MNYFLINKGDVGNTSDPVTPACTCFEKFYDTNYTCECISKLLIIFYNK